MNCPRCNYPNGPGVEFCTCCHEILLHAPSKTFMRTLHKSSRMTHAPASHSSFWNNRKHFSKKMKAFFHHTGPWLLIGGGLILLCFGMVYYSSPIVRLKLNGVHLDNRTAQTGPVTYLAGNEVNTQGWAYRGEEMDTPLKNQKVTETGTVSVELASGDDTHRILRVRVKEWIKIAEVGDRNIQQVIPMNHPSIAPSTVILDRQGTVVDRQQAETVRTGRLTDFLFPRFPKGSERIGDSWTEPLTWMETVGEWKVRWEGNIQWTLEGFEPCYENLCARLTYQVKMDPQQLMPPEWAAKISGSPSFEGQGHGEALYEVKEKVLLSNTFSYGGDLSIPLSNLGDIPWDQRVGDHAPSEAGTVLLRFTDKFDIRKL